MLCGGSCTLCAWNARGPSSQPGPAVHPPPPSQAASPQQFAVDAPPPREDFLHHPERGDTPRGTLVLAPASAGDGEAPEKRRSSGGRWARGAAPWSRGVGPATSWVTAWPVRPVPRGPDTSQLSRGRSVPPGQAAVFIRAPPPTARLSFGCGSSSERAQPCPRTLEPCRSPQASPGTHTAPSAPQRCLGLLDAGSHSREVAGPPHSAHGARALPPPGSRHSREVAGHPTPHTEPEPCHPRVTQQPVGSDVLRPGTRGGAGGLGLRALVWRPVSLRPARGLSPAAQARGSSAPHPVLFQLRIHRQPLGAAVASASSARPGRAGCEGTGPWPPTLTLRAWCMGVVTAAIEMAPHRLMPAPLRPCPEELQEQGSCQGEHLALTPGVWQRVVACGGVWRRVAA